MWCREIKQMRGLRLSFMSERLFGLNVSENVSDLLGGDDILDLGSRIQVESVKSKFTR